MLTAPTSVRLRLPSAAVMTGLSLVTLFMVIGASSLGSPGDHLALTVTVTAVGVLTSLWMRPACPAPSRRLRVPAWGASGHVQASTAYWCAVPAPRRPQRPRAPGQG